MTDGVNFDKSLDDITCSLRSFIGLSIRKDDKTWAEWIGSVAKEVDVKCWEMKGCARLDCPAHGSECGRCWLIAGSLCVTNSTTRGPDGTTDCIDCEVYLANVLRDPYSEIQEQIITLVHNLRSRQIELREMATHDSLTGLKNRHFLDMYMSHEMEKVKRGNVKMVIMMVDINDFKAANDTFGHVFGDRILKDCAGILTRSIRSSDVLFRFGGDEFMIVMSGAGRSEAMVLRQRILANVDIWNSRVKTHDFRISLSIGHAQLEESSGLNEALERADRVMYKDKRKYRLACQSFPQ